MNLLWKCLAIPTTMMTLHACTPFSFFLDVPAAGTGASPSSKYSLTYYEEASGSPVATESLSVGDSWTTRTVIPERSDSVFTGWSDESQNIYPPGTTQTLTTGASLKLTARWTAVTSVSVSWDALTAVDTGLYGWTQEDVNLETLDTTDLASAAELVYRFEGSPTGTWSLASDGADVWARDVYESDVTIYHVYGPTEGVPAEGIQATIDSLPVGFAAIPGANAPTFQIVGLSQNILAKLTPNVGSNWALSMGTVTRSNLSGEGEWGATWSAGRNAYALAATNVGAVLTFETYDAEPTVWVKDLPLVQNVAAYGSALIAVTSDTATTTTLWYLSGPGQTPEFIAAWPGTSAKVTQIAVANAHVWVLRGGKVIGVPLP